MLAIEICAIFYKFFFKVRAYITARSNGEYLAALDNRGNEILDDSTKIE